MVLAALGLVILVGLSKHYLLVLHIYIPPSTAKNDGEFAEWENILNEIVNEYSDK